MERTTVGTLILLPGLDGTGIMLSDIADELRKSFRVQIVSYPTDVFLDYEALLSFVRGQLPDGDVFILGESFSGPVALRLAQVEPQKVRAVILGASFARLDLPLKPILSLLSKILSPRMLPQRVLSAILLGRSSTAKRRETLQATLASVAPHVLAARAACALEVDLLTTNTQIQQPVMYLQASHDRLMPKTAAECLRAIAPDLQIRAFDAPHFLFQTAPVECAKTIRTFIAGID